MSGFRCLNCPDRPEFPDMIGLQDHWKATHTSPMTVTLELPQEIKAFFPEVQQKKVALYEAIK